MITQEKIDQHANRVETLITSFACQVSSEIDLVVAGVSAHLLETLKLKDGKVRQIPDNSSAILGVENVFHSLLNKSSFYPAILALISSFVDQVDEFREMYAMMADGLPDMQLDEDDNEVLGNQAAAALGAIEGQVLKVGLDLRNLLARSLGEMGVSDLVQGVSDVIRKLTRVEPIAKDQLILFFRMIGNLVYRSVEEKGYVGKYSFVGPNDERSRDFCNKLSSGDKFFRHEIDSMDNGQIPGVFDTGGGYGCRHWWVLAEAI
jgi:hypothetical protein